jgi:ribosomal protein S12 methylthiotransferase accessory factor YcaO
MLELIEWVLDALATERLDTAIVVDLTQAGIDIPVVHVTIPGLEAMFGEAHYTPGARMQRMLGELGASEGARR